MSSVHFGGGIIMNIRKIKKNDYIIFFEADSLGRFSLPDTQTFTLVQIKTKIFHKNFVR